MKRIYEPADIPDLPSASHHAINVDICDGLRLHIFDDGVVFELIVPGSEVMSPVISFEKVKEILSRKAKEQAHERDQDRISNTDT